MTDRIHIITFTYRLKHQRFHIQEKNLPEEKQWTSSKTDPNLGEQELFRHLEHALLKCFLLM